MKRFSWSRIALVLTIPLAAARGAESVKWTPAQAEAHFPQDATPLNRDRSAPPASYASVLEKVTPSVVSIFPARLAVEGEDSEGDVVKRFFGQQRQEGGEDSDDRILGVGSGVIVSSDGYILTNSHVVHLPSGKLADEVIVEFSTKRRADATIVGVDPRADIAVLKVDAAGLPALPMADSESIAVGDLVFAVGNPFRIGITATMGMVSAVRRSGIGLTGADGYERFIQTDAAINPGNSGGALCDADGRLVGINTAIINVSGGNIGIGFAVPVNLARLVLLNVLEHGEVVRGFVGARVKSVDDAVAKEKKLAEVRGVVVEEVLENGPAAAGGLKKGDVVLEIGGRPVEDASAFRIATAFASPGSTLEMTGERGGERRKFSVTVGNQAAAGTAGSVMSIGALPGVELEEAGGESPGVLVKNVEESSPYRKTLLSGMRIVSINNAKVATREDVADALRPGPNKVEVQRDGETETLLIKVK